MGTSSFPPAQGENTLGGIPQCLSPVPCEGPFTLGKGLPADASSPRDRNSALMGVWRHVKACSYLGVSAQYEAHLI